MPSRTSNNNNNNNDDPGDWSIHTENVNELLNFTKPLKL